MRVTVAERDTYATGLRAENLARWCLRLKGYRILQTRYKTPVGEVDLIAVRGKTLAFVEVKSRATMEQALHAVTNKMQTRITRAARHFLAQYAEYNDHAMRFDLITVKLPFYIRHLDNAWRPPA